MPQRLSDIEIDEVSLVDRPANQHSHIVIAKRADQEDAVPDEIQLFDADGQPVDEGDLEIGDVVQDAEGNLYEYTDEADGAEADEAGERELVGVGKSAFFEAPPSNSALAGLRAELSKALSTSDNATLSKAFDVFEEIEKRAAAAESKADALEQIAKREREIRLEREYIAKAAEYNVPVPAGELGPVLMHCAEALPYEDCVVLNKALTAAGQMLFTEAGFTGLADPNDPFEVIEREVEASVAKGAGTDSQVSKAQAMTSYFDSNPEAYAAYRAGREF